MAPLARLLVPATAALALFTLALPAQADRSIIKQPGDHLDYSFEAEPHGILGFWGVPGPGHGTGLGVGFRGSIPIVDNGFVKTINNSVAISFGADWVHFDVNPDRGILWLPVAMQWNFWLSENWSVFGEPGLALRFDDHHNNDLHLDFVFYGGGRFHFSKPASLTMRIGWPSALTVGVSFFL